QQQGPRHYQAMLRREVRGNALEPPDPGPELRPGRRGADHRRVTRDRQRSEGRVSRVLHLKPEEPKMGKVYNQIYNQPHEPSGAYEICCQGYGVVKEVVKN